MKKGVKQKRTPRKGEPTRAVNYRLRGSLCDRLEAHHEATGRTKTDIIETLLDNGLPANPDPLA